VADERVAGRKHRGAPATSGTETMLSLPHPVGQAGSSVHRSVVQERRATARRYRIGQTV